MSDRSAQVRNAAAPAKSSTSIPIQRQVRPFYEAEETPTAETAHHHLGQFAIAPPPTRQAKSEAESDVNTTGMPDTLKSGLETLSGLDLSDVQVHRDSAKPAEVGALAYAEGQNIYLGSGQEQHLPHEGWHVVQQMQGRVQPTTHVNGSAVNDDPALETEADVMGSKALQTEKTWLSEQPTQAARGTQQHGTGAVQRVAQRVAPAALAFAGLSAEAWGMASSVVGAVSGIGGAASASYHAVSRGENGFGSLVLPQGLISNGDKGKLQQLIQFRIINAYVQRFLARPENRQLRDELMGTASPGAAPGSLSDPTACHPPMLCPPDPAAPTPGPASTPTFSSTATPTSTPPPTAAPTATGGGAAEPTRPTGAPTASGIDQEVLTAVKNDVQTQLETLLETPTARVNREFMWGEGDARNIGEIGSGPEEAVGVTGFLRFRNIETSILRETPQLSSAALAALGEIPGNGTEVIIHKFLGGSIGGQATWSAWDNLTVNIEGNAVQQGVHGNGSTQLTARTHWYWDRWGPNSETYMQNELYIQDSGEVEISVSYEGTP